MDQFFNPTVEPSNNIVLQHGLHWYDNALNPGQLSMKGLLRDHLMSSNVVRSAMTERKQRPLI